MSINIVAEQEFHVGDPIEIEGAAPEGPFAVMFEDDGDTGYFYALDVSQSDDVIRDAVHIYNVGNVTEREKPSVIEIGWSLDSKKAVLLINDYPHAIFDFEARRGYCRTGFPPAAQHKDWSADGHSWNEAAIGLFA